jgi:ectoine hydroxylase-related dioxygenase (phytanoyl-CoA dioxygenase family)
MKHLGMFCLFTIVIGTLQQGALAFVPTGRDVAPAPAPRRGFPSSTIIISSSRSFQSTSALASSLSSSSSSSVNPSSLLYEEHEKLLVSRGEFEAQLMANTHSPLQANIVKGSGGSGGFGNSSSGGSSKKSLLKTQAKSHVKVLLQEGVVRIDNVLDHKLVDELRQRVDDMRVASEQLVQEGTVPDAACFANVLLNKNRRDMTIPLGPRWVTEALHSLLVASPVGRIFQDLLGPDAILYELSCMMSDPNSQRQVVHPDTPHKETAVLYTCFVALQDISIDMGPTTWLPRTHTQEMHERFQDESSSSSLTTPKDQLLSSQPSVLGIFPKGSCAIFDSRLLHCGGANTSETSRAIFYCTFQNPNVVNVGNPGSIRKDLIGQWRLQELQKDLELYKKGKATKKMPMEEEEKVSSENV